MRNTILFIEWKSFGNAAMRKAFEKIGYTVEMYGLEHKKIDTRIDMVYTEALVKHLIAKPYYCVFSFNYFPIVAMACKACKVPYVSWTYDSPFIQLYSKTLEYDTNFAFVFDSGTCRELEEKGLRTYYLPMAAPLDCYSKVVQDKVKGKKYASDISFVGALYNETHNNMFRHLEKLEAYEKGFIDALLNAQKNIYGVNFIENVLKENPEVFQKIQQVCPVFARGDGIENAEWTLANYFLSRKVTAMERMEIMQLLGERYRVNLYTVEKTDIMGVRNCGVADYNTIAPHVYANSKINLNISLRSIHTGIPLRAFDIMGCGGFMITNFQEDFLQHFEPDEEVVFYSSYEELLEKVEYYLKHDEKRNRIARNAQQKVATEHTYLQRAQTMFSFVSEYWS